MVSTRHHRTLARVFASPTPSDLRWGDVEALLRAHGAEITEGAGSRLRIRLNGVRMVLHKPHPRPVLIRGAVRALARFLAEAGITPETPS